jgi:hypothetical protein
MNITVYFCFFEYFATGEGLTFSMGVVGAENPEQAARTFVAKYVCRDTTPSDLSRQVDYFCPCVKAYDLHDERNHPAIRDILKDFVSGKVIDGIFAAEMDHALHEFNFHIYTNYS